MTASLAAELSRIAGQAFAAEGLSENFGIVQPSDRPDLAQFQCNGALAAAKAAKANPRAIAEKIAARLKADPLFAKVEIAGPGFLNLDLTDAALDARAGQIGDGAPAPNGKLPWNYQQMAAFQMTPAQIEYNKTRGRYVP